MTHDEYMDEIVEVIREVRKEERRRAAAIVRDFEIYTPYIVNRIKIATNKAGLISQILGDEEDEGVFKSTYYGA